MCSDRWASFWGHTCTLLQILIGPMYCFFIICTLLRILIGQKYWFFFIILHFVTDFNFFDYFALSIGSTYCFWLFCSLMTWCLRVPVTASPNHIVVLLTPIYKEWIHKETWRKIPKILLKNLFLKWKIHLFVHTGKWFDQKVLNWLNTDST